MLWPQNKNILYTFSIFSNVIIHIGSAYFKTMLNVRSTFFGCFNSQNLRKGYLFVIITSSVTLKKYIYENKKINRYRAQSFTSLMTDLHQDINRVSSFIVGALMEHFLEGIAPLRHWYINLNEKSNKYKSSHLPKP